VKSQWTVLVGYDILLSRQMLAVIKHADDNIIYLSATQLIDAPAHRASTAAEEAAQNPTSFLLS